jgi:hypothetical protein
MAGWRIRPGSDFGSYEYFMEFPMVANAVSPAGAEVPRLSGKRSRFNGRFAEIEAVKARVRY